MRIVDEQHGPEPPRKRCNPVERSQVSFHAEDPVGGDDAKAIVLVPALFQQALKVRHIGMLVDFLIDELGPAEALAVDDARMVQPVAVQDVLVHFHPQFLVDYRREETFVCRKA